MDLYPAIDLRGGRCVRLVQGDFSQQTVYGDDPVSVAQAYEAAGAQWIHVVDLDASRGDGSNRDVVVAIAAAVGIPVQTGGGVRDGSLLEQGIQRVVLGSLAVNERDRAGQLVSTYGTRTAIGLDHRDGELRTHGWEERGGVEILDAARWPEFVGTGAFVVTDIARDGMLQGPDLEGYARLVSLTDTPVVASGGVGTLDDLRALRDVGVAGVIVGKALYEGRFTVEEALEACRP
ncbi:MAG TPA: 1-(5-phosphoribosyl)-5-[(5-phosphoribosylamino)methylideneamino]imidazole-4-carboxamide isomerase [Acidimicrobiales bacterium]|nr:1-(5-phosphoribosyl)-5-[(5-phosphoribosylamino)methylideneamino]imidazole-4-carboxamide isomerase [Acidimicrobiales bacterium]